MVIRQWRVNMKPRRGCVIAALCVTLAAISVHIIALALPFWQITTVPTGDVTQGLWATCITYNEWSECWSHSTTEAWLDIVRTLEMMALFLLFLALVGMVVYLLDVFWKDILHAVIVISLLMAATLIIVGIIIYGLNYPMEQLQVSFGLALVAAIFALIAAILLLVVYPCCMCCQTRRQSDEHNDISVMDRDPTTASSVVIEREPTLAWSRENTKLSRNCSQFSWRSSSRVEPANENHTEYIRTTTQISRQTSTPVKPLRDEKQCKYCRCCRFFCLFTCCKCCHVGKDRKCHTTVKRELHETVCITCGRDSYKHLTGIEKSTSITSLQHKDVATSDTWLQQKPIQQPKVDQMQSNKSGNAHSVTTGINYNNYQPICTNRSTCMTPQHENGERNRKWNHHRSTIIPCGRNIPASAFSVHHGPHAPCPFSVFCCRCKHSIQSKSTENNRNEQLNGRNRNYLCDCQLGDIKLCDKCLAKREINNVVPRNQNHGQPARAIKPNTRVYRSNALVQSKPTLDDQGGDRDKPKNSIDKAQQRKHVMFGQNPSSNNDSSEFQPSDDDNDSTNDNNDDRTSENDEDDNYNYIDDDGIYEERKLQSHQNEYETPSVHQVKPRKTYKSNIRNDAKPSGISGTNRNETPVESAANRVEHPSVGDEQVRKPVSSPSNKDTLSGVKPPVKPNTNGDTKPHGGNNPRKKPRVLSHSDNQVGYKPTNDSKRPKSESDANHNGIQNAGDDSGPQTTKKKTHKWVPPKWKGLF